MIENDDYRKNLEKALNYYENNFICDNGIPKYYKDSIFPIDSTAAAQTIITLVKFGCMESAQKVVEWIVLNMQNIKGYFYFQRKKFYTNKISYMRWSNAWMLSALSYFILKSERL